MPSPIFLAAASFFSVIAVGSLLVAINDWLESRNVDPQPAVGVSPSRVTYPIFERRHKRSIGTPVRGRRHGPRGGRGDPVVDWF